MKKGMVLMLCVFMTMISWAQSTPQKFPYIIGTDKIPGYTVETKTCCLGSYVIDTQRRAPIIQYYVLNKSKFLKGTLSDEKQNKTEIIDIKFEDTEGESVFTVVGKKFSRSFTLRTWMILKESDVYTIFYTDKIGAWTINKKQ